MTKAKALRYFALSAFLIYGGGVIFSHLVYSADDRTACHRAGGFMGRIWCPDSVDTVGFQVHFVRALGWPVEIIPSSSNRVTEIELAAIKAKHEEDRNALRELQPLAEKGDVQAQVKLGFMYQEGLAGSPDFAEAARWFQAAADRGEPEAQNSLSFAFEKGLGVGQNFVEAYKWASLAAAQDSEKSLANRDTLLANMSASQIEEAERQVRAWKPKAGSANASLARKAAARAAVRDVQGMLNILGYNVGEPDGVAGPRTREAINQFQLKDGMATSGQVSDELIARLKNSVQAKQAETTGNR